jgi:spore maturation protein CgeB
MKILFAALRYEYGNKNAGDSFEYKNFFESLKRMPGVSAEAFWFDEVMAEKGRDEMNRLLLQTVKETRPDLLFCFLFTEEIKKETIQYITQKTGTLTLNWFADDHWRFPIFSRHWAPLFSAVCTTDSQAVLKYRRLGIGKVIKTQWGVNTELFKPAEEKEPNLDITFVGQNYSIREKYIRALEKAGLPVKAFGTGFKAGRIAKERTSQIWASSKINLNFTESSAYGAKFFFKSLVKLFVKKELGRYRFDGQNFFANLQSAWLMRRRQIKSRNFEIPACGGFLLTNDADNLRDYYEDGKEIVIFKNTEDLIEKCGYYLKNETQREQIAHAGYLRTIKDHTYEKRFEEIFRSLNLK